MLVISFPKTPSVALDFSWGDESYDVIGQAAPPNPRTATYKSDSCFQATTTHRYTPLPPEQPSLLSMSDEYTGNANQEDFKGSLVDNSAPRFSSSLRPATEERT